MKKEAKGSERKRKQDNANWRLRVRQDLPISLIAQVQRGISVFGCTVEDMTWCRGKKTLATRDRRRDILEYSGSE
jgi:hypothetical protein